MWLYLMYHLHTQHDFFHTCTLNIWVSWYPFSFHFPTVRPYKKNSCWQEGIFTCMCCILHMQLRAYHFTRKKKIKPPQAHKQTCHVNSLRGRQSAYFYASIVLAALNRVRWRGVQFFEVCLFEIRPAVAAPALSHQ
jgi:hypothetical protein